MGVFSPTIRAAPLFSDRAPIPDSVSTGSCNLSVNDERSNLEGFLSPPVNASQTFCDQNKFAQELTSRLQKVKEFEH